MPFLDKQYVILFISLAIWSSFSIEKTPKNVYNFEVVFGFGKF